MSGRAAKILLTETMYRILNELCNRRMIEKIIQIRAKIILLAYRKLQNVEISGIVGMERHCVVVTIQPHGDGLICPQITQIFAERNSPPCPLCLCVSNV